MSDTQLDFPFLATIPYSVLSDEDICANSKIFFGVLCGLSHTFGYCFASDKQLADLFGKSESQVQIWLQMLESKGHIERVTVNVAQKLEDGRTVFRRKRKILVDVGYSRKVSDTPENKGTFDPPENKGDNIETLKNKTTTRTTANAVELVSSPAALPEWARCKIPTQKQADIIASLANEKSYDLERIKPEFERQSLHNAPGWLYKAIKDNFQPSAREHADNTEKDRLRAKFSESMQRILNLHQNFIRNNSWITKPFETIASDLARLQKLNDETKVLLSLPESLEENAKIVAFNAMDEVEFKRYQKLVAELKSKNSRIL
jgi:hypothetical protein